LDRLEKIIDLKEDKTYIEEYVSLRNRYRELLLTKPVTAEETLTWLQESSIEARGVVHGSHLVGVVILYLSRKGEIAFFAKYPNQGLGTRLLKIIEDVAKEKELQYLWAWVLRDNGAAQRTFKKNGYTVERESSKVYEHKKWKGIIFKKDILQGRTQ
jgi:GNAT superfamily N-acetyltransferase